jgi:hypothetical protein
VPGPAYLPIRFRGQWFEVLPVGFITYSYGDSAGFTPDFPFNDDEASTKIGVKVMENDALTAQCLQQTGNAVVFDNCFAGFEPPAESASFRAEPHGMRGRTRRDDDISFPA